MNKAFFVDKDGVINNFIYENDGKLMAPANIEQLKILPFVKEGLGKIKKMGFKLIAISNQPGVEFGYLTEKNLKEIDQFLINELGLDAVYNCMHHPQRNCDCRKPKIGLIKKAEKDFDIDEKNSYLAGDNLSDIQTGKNAGVKATFRIGIVREDILELQHKKNIYPDYTLPNLIEVANKIERISNIMSDKLELGCGQKPSEGYLHQDVTLQEGIELDFTCNPWEISLPENTLSEVIALGVMEHLRFEDFDKTLIHMKKILKSNGKFLFDVPDMRVWSEYLYNVTHGRADKNPFPPKHIWATIYGWQRWTGDEHKCGWTKDELIKHLKDIGFKDAKEGMEVFTSKGISRGRFTRPGDAHIYIEATK